MGTKSEFKMAELPGRTCHMAVMAAVPFFLENNKIEWRVRVAAAVAKQQE
jgi:hypothetical protein